VDQAPLFNMAFDLNAKRLADIGDTEGTVGMVRTPACRSALCRGVRATAPSAPLRQSVQMKIPAALVTRVEDSL
jgi:hypothetical protein